VENIDINLLLKKAINEKDFSEIRNILTTSMIQDPGFNKGVFDERLKRCFDAGISENDIFVPFEGEPFNDDRKTWTNDYYAKQQTELRYNFSVKRLEHCKGIGRELFSHGYTSPYTSPSKEEEKKKREDSGGSRQSQSSQGENEGLPKWLFPAIGIGAAAILLWLLFRRK